MILLNNLFSIFDASGSYLFLNWSSALLLVVFMVNKFWLLNSSFHKILVGGVLVLESQIMLNFGSNKSPGHSLWLVSCFVFLLLNNVLGLLPYVFASTSHLVFTFSFAFLSWFSYVVWTLIVGLGQFMAHLVPLGTPVVLMPLMVLIELVSNFIRPITLSVRLMANMVAGHLLLTLISGSMTGGGELVFLSVFLVLLCFVVLESGVALIQSYVFSMLSSLYLSESNKSNFYYL